MFPIQVSVTTVTIETIMHENNSINVVLLWKINQQHCRVMKYGKGKKFI